MIWAILILLGVPLWLCAIGILALVMGNRSLRRRDGDIPVRVQRAGKSRWIRGHAVWVADVFAWRGSPAAWSEDLCQVIATQAEIVAPAELKKLHGLGASPVVATLTPDVGEPFRVAVTVEYGAALFGRFGSTHEQSSPKDAH